jgi:hypothetical protein
MRLEGFLKGPRPSGIQCNPEAFMAKTSYGKRGRVVREKSMAKDHNPEFEAFKCFDLRVYAVAQGYKIGQGKGESGSLL